MPIYAYRCAACGHAQDVLQKLSDPVLTVCPSCGAESFAKQVTAAGFQLKGSGWYVTDFRNGQAKPGAKPEAKADAPAEGAGAAPAAESKPADKAAAAPAAPAPAAKTADKPAAPSAGTPSSSGA